MLRRLTAVDIELLMYRAWATCAEPYRKYVAHDEKSKFFIFFPEIAYMVSLETLCDFFLEIFF